jgi:hypothetical protein
MEDYFGLSSFKEFFNFPPICLNPNYCFKQSTLLVIKSVWLFCEGKMEIQPKTKLGN